MDKCILLPSLTFYQIISHGGGIFFLCHISMWFSPKIALNLPWIRKKTSWNNYGTIGRRTDRHTCVRILRIQRIHTNIFLILQPLSVGGNTNIKFPRIKIPQLKSIKSQFVYPCPFSVSQSTLEINWRIHLYWDTGFGRQSMIKLLSFDLRGEDFPCKNIRDIKEW